MLYSRRYDGFLFVMEEARARKHKPQIFSMNIHRAFVSLPHSSVLYSCRRSAVFGRPLEYLDDLLRNRSLLEYISGILDLLTL